MLGCPNCGKNKTIVIDSRDNGTTVRRRRKCLGCGHRYTTYEEIKKDIVLKKEQESVIKDYRRFYPDDKRSDEDIFKSIKSVEDNHTFETLTYWAANILGIVKG